MIKFKSPVGTISDGGAPLYLDDFVDIQDTQARYGISYLEYISLNNNGIIVDGMSITGAGPYTIQPGYIYLDDDLRFFPSTNIATLTGYIVVDTDLVESRVFFDGNNNPIKVTKRAKWQAGAPAMGFDGVNVATLTSITGSGNDYKLGQFVRGVPKGGIIMWDNNGYIPLGFALCDGSFGTPNLTGKFVRANTTAGGTGGSGSFTIATGNLPSHSHSITAAANHQHGILNDGDHGHRIRSSNVSMGVPLTWTIAIESASVGGDEGYVYATNDLSSLPLDPSVYIARNGAHDHGAFTVANGAHDHGAATGNTGSGTAINFVPTYHDLIFIKRIA